MKYNPYNLQDWLAFVEWMKKQGIFEDEIQEIMRSDELHKYENKYRKAQ